MGQGIDQILDFDHAEGDCIDHYFQPDPSTFDSALENPIIADPVGEGFLTVTQTGAGVLVALTAGAGTGLLLINTSLDMLPPDFFI